MIIWIEFNVGFIGIVVGLISFDFCVGDGVVDFVAFEVIGVFDNFYVYLIIDENDFLVSVIDLVFDFENIQEGIYCIYGVFYIGQIFVFLGVNIFIDLLFDDCYDLIGQFVEINVVGVDGGVVFIDFGIGQDVISICQGDGEFNVIIFFNSLIVVGVNYIYVLMNDVGIIFGFVLGGNQFDFEIFGIGVVRIYGIFYMGNLLVGLGQVVINIQFFDGCVDFLDNFVIVLRDVFEGGSFIIGIGEIDILVCFGLMDGMVEFVIISGFFNSYFYLFMDVNNIVIDMVEGNSFNFV